MTTSLTVYPSAIVISNLKYSDKWNNVLKTRIKKLFVFSHRILWYVNYLSIINKIYIYIERYLGLSRTLGLEISISISRLKKHHIGGGDHFATNAPSTADQNSNSENQSMVRVCEAIFMS